VNVPYRQAAAIIARSEADGKFLIVKKPRVHHAWQFPQGGVEAGEDLKTAALREFAEELGTNRIEIVGDVRGTFQYDFPANAEFPDYVTEKWSYRGQQVHFFFARFIGTEADIRLQEEELAEYRFVAAPEVFQFFENPDYADLTTAIVKNV